MNEWEWQLLEERTPLDCLLISGVELRPGDLVRLRPRAGGDVLDLALSGKTAIILDTFLNQKRTESRRLRPGPLPEQLDLVADPQAREPQAALEAGELYAAVAALPGDFRDVLVAVDITGLSYKEAASALGIREGTVMSRLYRARQQVVRRIDGCAQSD